MSVWLEAGEDLGRRRQDPTWIPAHVTGCRVTKGVRGRQIVECVKRGEAPGTRLSVTHTHTHVQLLGPHTGGLVHDCSEVWLLKTTTSNVLLFLYLFLFIYFFTVINHHA